MQSLHFSTNLVIVRLQDPSIMMLLQSQDCRPIWQDAVAAASKNQDREVQ
jgi:hypothetical protein